MVVYVSCREKILRQPVVPLSIAQVLVALACFCAAQLAFAAGASPEINIATYNLRLNTASDGANAWPHRVDAVRALIRYHEFDIVGTQEGLPEQITDLDAMPGFAHVGIGRDDGKDAGEHSAIYYRTARFEVEKHGDYWLSETPDRPSKGWDAKCCNRIASWAKFHDRVNGRRFFVFNVHFDHQGEVARRESAKLMLRKMREIAGNATMICIGDFNSTPETEQIQTMKTALRDAREVSAEPAYGPQGTFEDFKLDSKLPERIDYIFVGRGVEVLKYATLTDSVEARFPSDHLPVVARVRLP
ncbi:endonuclease/exonuclease/phosphatase family protein [Rudaea cellulosilytica]|uniref:endonuclease/exonuclease/phosphatase family protein n=1 Tax=Rudaea cellulosilytica TaxID=540746 RepID=UPI0003A54F28|nr:endonuclease/exonuclease/phosphatase family protein [Rudaea cellulosilytica]